MVRPPGLPMSAATKAKISLALRQPKHHHVTSIMPGCGWTGSPLAAALLRALDRAYRLVRRSSEV